jgi:hypothetical protein
MRKLRYARALDHRKASTGLSKHTLGILNHTAQLSRERSAGRSAGRVRAPVALYSVARRFSQRTSVAFGHKPMARKPVLRRMLQSWGPRCTGLECPRCLRRRTCARTGCTTLPWATVAMPTAIPRATDGRQRRSRSRKPQATTKTLHRRTSRGEILLPKQHNRAIGCTAAVLAGEASS